MICLAVTSNGRHLCLAGDPDAIVQVDIASGTHIGSPPRRGFALRVTAATGDAFAQWAARDLFVGDEVLIKVVESSHADPVTLVYTEAEFEELADKRGLLLARGMYAALRSRMRVLEQEYGDRLTEDEDA
jgi:hypothetical protein